MRKTLAIAIASIALGIASTAAVATGPMGNPGSPFLTAPPSCDVPALPGAVVDVILADMPGTMMGQEWGPAMMGPGPTRSARAGAPPDTRCQACDDEPFAEPTTVPQGQVSFRVVNRGAWIHELAVLPLGSGQNIGQRRIEADNQVDESASLGHVEGSCGADKGDGIVPGATGWTTITLAPGRYELVCNIAGHYRAGMYATEATPASVVCSPGKYPHSVVGRTRFLLGSTLRTSDGAAGDFRLYCRRAGWKTMGPLPTTERDGDDVYRPR